MGRETEYEHEEQLLVSLADGGCETVVTVRLGLLCTHHSYLGCFSPIDGGQPPEGPEFDIASFWVISERDGDKTSSLVAWNKAVIFFGREIMDALFERACDAAAATGDF